MSGAADGDRDRAHYRGREVMRRRQVGIGTTDQRLLDTRGPTGGTPTVAGRDSHYA